MIARKYETIVGFFVVASLAALLAMVVIVDAPFTGSDLPVSPSR